MARPPLPENVRKSTQIRLMGNTAKKIRFIIMLRDKKETFDDIISKALDRTYATELKNFDQFLAQQDNQ